MKKQGICLIELLVYMFIMCLFCSIGFISYRQVVDMEKNMVLDRTVAQCRDFIIMSKNICRKKETTGNIAFNETEGELLFFIGVESQQKLQLPKDIKIRKITFNDRKIYIDNTGYIKNAGGIYLEQDGDIKKITVGVYTNYVCET